MSWEIYSNSLTTTRSYEAALMDLRGGTGYVFNNTMVGTQSVPFFRGATAAMELDNYRSQDYATASPWTTECSDSQQLRICVNPGTNAKSCSSDATCGGEAGSCQFADDPSGDGRGSPCRDQIGRSTNMASRPALFWNNVLRLPSAAANAIGPVVVDAGLVRSHIVAGRDYCHSATTMPSSCNGVSTIYSPFAYPHPLLSAVSASTPNPPENVRADP
jgi:hypothetical protein